MRHRGWLAAMAVALGASHLDAQTCLGRGSFSTGAIRASANYRDDAMDILGGELSYGFSRSFFASAQFDHYSPRDRVPEFRSSRNFLGALVGTQISAGSPSVQVCSLVGFGASMNSSESPATQIDSHTPRLSAGGAIGFATGPDTAFHVIPSLALQFVHEETSGTITNSGVQSHFVGSTANYGLTTVSLGFAKGPVVFTPFFYKAFNLTNTIGRWGVSLSYSFGRAR